MSEAGAIKEYLKKLQKTINFDSTLNLGRFRLVKKGRIDDIMCCIYATLPDSYKKMLKTKVDVQRYNSVICYGLLTKLLAKTFFLDKSLCIVNINEINNLIASIILSFERDAKAIEKLYDE